VILPVLLFSLGVALLVAGAWLLVGGGTRVAAVLGVPTVVVGLTVVAFGTSAPELFVSMVGALQGNTGLVLGNVIGSNVANVGLILALAAICRPVAVERGLVRRELPLLMGVTLLFSALAWDGTVARWEAGLLVAVFVWFIVWTIRGAHRGVSPTVPLPADLTAPPAGRRLRGLALGAAMVAIGVGGLAWGGQIIVGASLSIAQQLGVSETLIGLTLVAVGTSLPELATTIVASLKGESDLALGNIVGSNLFNVLAVAGPVGLLRPLRDTDGAIQMQLTSMMLLTVMFLVATRAAGPSLGRGRGSLLLVAYLMIMVAWTTRT
jgi:cation:H+ antiporter